MSALARRASVALALLAQSACLSADAGEVGSTPLIDRIEWESAELVSLFDVTTAGALAFLALLVVLGGRLLDAFAERLIARESPLAKVVDESRPLVKAVVLGVVVLMLVRAFFVTTPLVGGTALLVLLAGAAFRLGAAMPAWLAGLMLVVRREVHVHDRVLIGAREGVIVRAGLATLRVRFDDGSEANVPLSLLGTGAASTSSPRSAVAIEVRQRLARALTPDELGRLEVSVRLSPYRDAAHAVRVRVDADDDTKVVVSMHTWSDAAVPLARAFIMRAAHGLLTREHA